MSNGKLPSPATTLYDVDWAAGAFEGASLEGIRWIANTLFSTARREHLLYLRREALRMRATVDIDTLTALLIGRIEFRCEPDHPIVQTLFERLYHAVAHPLWELAIRDFLITGVGGVCLTPFGVYPLRPEHCVAYPSWHRPRWTARVAFVAWEDAKKVLKWRGLKPVSLEARDPLVYHDAVVPVIEIADGEVFRYYHKDRLVGEFPIEARYGHFWLVGAERSLHTGLRAPLDTSMGYGAFVEMAERAERDYYYAHETEPGWIDLPIGTLERVVRTRYRGYNLYEAYEKLVEAIMKESLKGRYALYQFDIFDEDSESFHEFEDVFHAIGYNAPEPSAKPPITFLGGVSLPEIQVGLREVEGIITTITGVNPYMLGQVGVTRVASEVVAMQQNTNLKLQTLHEQVARVLDPFVRAFQHYLILLPRPLQPLLVEPYETDEGSRYLVVGNADERLLRNPIFQQIGDFADYESFFSQCRISLAYTGHVSLMERRQNYMQALQLITSLFQLLAQTGQMYELTPLVDRILRDLGVDVRALKRGGASAPPQEPAMLMPTEPAMPAVPTFAMEGQEMNPFMLGSVLLEDSEMEPIPETEAILETEVSS